MRDLFSPASQQNVFEVVHTVACGGASFFLGQNNHQIRIPLPFIHSAVDGCLDCLHLW